MDYKIVNMTEDEWPQVKEIYLSGIKTGVATFQTDAPSYEEWDKGHLQVGRLLAVRDGEVLGWVALSPTSSRRVYAGVVEVSLYIGEKYRGEGLGESLVKAVIKEGEDNGIWSFYSVIIRENAASLRLHEKCGFRKIGYREKIAKMSDGIWHDTIITEYRSKEVGID